MDSHMIISRCPSCGGCFLFIGKGGHLTCSLIGCKEPVVDRAVDNIKAEVERLKGENEKLKTNQELWGSIELITAQRVEVKKLKERLEDVYLKDTGKTKEINILTKENNQLRKALEKLAGHVGRMGRDIIDDVLKNSS